jgi:hypothetical protein
MKIHPVGAEMFHAASRTDGRTGSMTELIVALRKFFERAYDVKWSLSTPWQHKKQDVHTHSSMKSARTDSRVRMLMLSDVSGTPSLSSGMCW